MSDQKFEENYNIKQNKDNFALLMLKKLFKYGNRRNRKHRKDFVVYSIKLYGIYTKAKFTIVITLQLLWRNEPK